MPQNHVITRIATTICRPLRKDNCTINRRHQVLVCTRNINQIKNKLGAHRKNGRYQLRPLVKLPCGSRWIHRMEIAELHGNKQGTHHQTGQCKNQIQPYCIGDATSGRTNNLNRTLTIFDVDRQCVLTHHLPMISRMAERASAEEPSLILICDPQCQPAVKDQHRQTADVESPQRTPLPVGVCHFAQHRRLISTQQVWP